MKSIAFSGHGALIVSRHPSEVKVWDPQASSNKINVSPKSIHVDVARPVVFTSDGNLVATRSKSRRNAFHLWDTVTGNRVCESPQGVEDDPSCDVKKLLWVPTSTITMPGLVVCRKSSRSVTLYELHTDSQTMFLSRRYHAHESYLVQDVACSADGSYLAVALHHRRQYKGMVSVFDLTSDAAAPVFTHAHEKRIDAVAWSSKGMIAYGGYEFTHIFSWRPLLSDLPSPDRLHLQDGEHGCKLLTFSADGVWLAVASYDTIYVYDVPSRECLRQINLRTWNPEILSLSSDRTQIYTDRDVYDMINPSGPPPPGYDSPPRRFADLQHTYHLDPNNDRWILDRDGKKACILPPLDYPLLTAHADKVVIWDYSGLFLVIRLRNRNARPSV